MDERLGDLEVALAGRGIRLVLSGDRVELVTAARGRRADRPLRRRRMRCGCRPASLETLAIVAYRQPVTKSGVERIRGVDSDYSIRALLHRRLVVELGRSEAPGRPILYGTGFEFLERFGLTSLDDLPPLDLDVGSPPRRRTGRDRATRSRTLPAIARPAARPPAADGDDGRLTGAGRADLQGAGRRGRGLPAGRRRAGRRRAGDRGRAPGRARGAGGSRDAADRGVGSPAPACRRPAPSTSRSTSRWA